MGCGKTTANNNNNVLFRVEYVLHGSLHTCLFDAALSQQVTTADILSYVNDLLIDCLGRDLDDA